MVGLGDKFEVDTLYSMIMKQLTLFGSWIYSLGSFDEISDFVLRNDVPVEKLITHRFSIDHGAEAFALFDSGKSGKVVFVWDN